VKTSILYSVKIGGYAVEVKNVENLLNSIFVLSKFKDYEIHLFHSDELKTDVLSFLKKVKNEQVKVFGYKKISWYEWLNFSKKHSKNFEYVFLMHDDVFFLTNHFDEIFINEFKGIDNLGAASFIDDTYKSGQYHPQLRAAFHIDRIKYDSRKFALDYEYHNKKLGCNHKTYILRKIFDLVSKKNKIFYNFLSKFFINYKTLDFPKSKAKIHACFTNLMAFRSKNFNEINLTDLDVPHGLFADEDICLSTQNHGLINIISPNIHYIHDLPAPRVTRGHSNNQKDKEKVSKIFQNKWGFPPIKLETISYDERIDFINKIELLYSKKLTWSKETYSYEWTYI